MVGRQTSLPQFGDWKNRPDCPSYSGPFDQARFERFGSMSSTGNPASSDEEDSHVKKTSPPKNSHDKAPLPSPASLNKPALPSPAPHDKAALPPPPSHNKTALPSPASQNNAALPPPPSHKKAALPSPASLERQEKTTASPADSRLSSPGASAHSSLRRENSGGREQALPFKSRTPARNLESSYDPSTPSRDHPESWRSKTPGRDQDSSFRKGTPGSDQHSSYRSLTPGRDQHAGYASRTPGRDQDSFLGAGLPGNSLESGLSRRTSGEERDFAQRSRTPRARTLSKEELPQLSRTGSSSSEKERRKSSAGGLHREGSFGGQAAPVSQVTEGDSPRVLLSRMTKRKDLVIETPDPIKIYVGKAGGESGPASPSPRSKLPTFGIWEPVEPEEESVTRKFQRLVDERRQGSGTASPSSPRSVTGGKERDEMGDVQAGGPPGSSLLEQLLDTKAHAGEGSLAKIKTPRYRVDPRSPRELLSPSSSRKSVEQYNDATQFLSPSPRRQSISGFGTPGAEPSMVAPPRPASPNAPRPKPPLMSPQGNVPTPAIPGGGNWSCAACTFLNADGNEVCEMCLTGRKYDVGPGAKSPATPNGQSARSQLGKSPLGHAQPSPTTDRSNVPHSLPTPESAKVRTSPGGLVVGPTVDHFQGSSSSRSRAKKDGSRNPKSDPKRPPQPSPPAPASAGASPAVTPKRDPLAFGNWAESMEEGQITQAFERMRDARGGGAQPGTDPREDLLKEGPAKSASPAPTPRSMRTPAFGQWAEGAGDVHITQAFERLRDEKGAVSSPPARSGSGSSAGKPGAQRTPAPPPAAPIQARPAPPPLHTTPTFGQWKGEDPGVGFTVEFERKRQDKIAGAGPQEAAAKNAVPKDAASQSKLHVGPTTVGSAKVAPVRSPGTRSLSEDYKVASAKATPAPPPQYGCCWTIPAVRD